MEGALDSCESLLGSGLNPLSVMATDPSLTSLEDELLSSGGSFLACSPSGRTPEGKAGVNSLCPVQELRFCSRLQWEHSDWS